MNQYNNITKDELIAVVHNIQQQYTLNYYSFFKMWNEFIYKFANENILFYDTHSIVSYNEVFQYNIEIGEFNYNIYFDIQRIIKLIIKNNINFIRINSDNDILKNNYLFTKEDIHLFKVQTEITPPIIVYLPIYRNHLTEYLVIDGNHRITKYHQNNETFIFNLIKPYNLRLECFCDLNSWILYQFYTNQYYITQIDYRYYNQIIQKNENILNETSKILLDQQ